jgi:hypothetical protein
MNADFDEMIRAGLSRAKEMGIAEPVLTMLSPQVPQACAIYEEVEGRTLEMPPGREEMAVLLPLSLPEAARLIRRHGGQGGAVAADILEDGILVDYWLAILTPQTLNLLAFRAGKEICRAGMGYSKVSRRVRSLTNLLNDDGPSLLPLKTGEGQNMIVCGPCGGVTSLAAALAGIALTRQLPISQEGRIVSVPVDEDQLASFLLNAFNDPKVISEALMTLKKMKGDKDHWLRQVLRRPELRTLAERVEEELTGG